MTAKFRNMAVVSASLVVLSTCLLPASAIRAQPASPGCRTYEATGKQVCGRFLEYWDGHGGLAQQGYPISNNILEVSPIDGKSYNVQYFERTVFEYHPDLAQPNDVLLSLLGRLAYESKYPNGAGSASHSDQKVNSGPGAIKFPETGHVVGGKFLAYWQEHGGLAQHGYPISEEFTEVSELNGKPYTVQYFERAVFELHPEHAGTPYEVLLSQLGTMQFKARYPNGEPGTTPLPGTPLAEGTWGGNHLQMTVHLGGAELEFDCAHATITQTLLVANNTLDVAGTYVQEHGGPIREGEPPDAHPVRLLGTLNGNTLNLTVVLTDKKQAVGTYVLVLGQQGVVRKCL